MIASILFVLSVIGTWQYVGFHFDGKFYPIPNPELVLRFTFRPDQTSHLIWYRENEEGFCEREATYTLEDDLLTQKVTWVNPANDFSCSSDPDMQMGRETITRIVLHGDELGFLMDIDGKEFIYQLKAVAPQAPAPQ